MKLIVKILIALAIVGVLLLGIGLTNGGELYTALQDGELVALQDTVEQIDRASEPIDPDQDYDFFGISVTSGSCTIKTGTYLAHSSDVEVLRNNANAIFFNVTSDNAEIVLPAHKLPQLDIIVTEGSALAEDLYADKLSLTCRSGVLSIEEAESDTCYIGAAKATVTVDDLDAAQLEISSEQSDMTLDVDGDPRDYHCISDLTESTVVWDGKPFDQRKFGETNAPRALTLTATESKLTFDP